MSNQRRTTTEDAHRRWRAAGLRVPAVVLATAVTFGGLSAVVDAVATAAPPAATNASPEKKAGPPKKKVRSERERHLQKQAQLDRKWSGKGGTKAADPGQAKHKAKPSGQAKAPDKANSSKKTSKPKTKAQAKTA
ncbi:hypothetical protein [Amycolatopsis sp. YIM 10]|uniref:hypothetical protein n=1 Tax=Amycolatopsis sp. YIM 10 TaxID=2653857 RepID=UPI00128FF72A|nr:hypothetical protein [Amycolatopsis sp. YIM 10]QFU89010.1 hypothetical protein YIM_19155 [Amycolatopsis sp. YIM 10]